MSNPIFSIILPVYNREDLVGRAIESVLAQSLTDWELLICDDGSTDNTRGVISRYLGDPRITLLTNTTNKGPSTCRNRLLERACGHYIAFLDSDDYFTLDALKKVFQHFKNSHGVDILTTVFEDQINGVFDQNYHKKVRRHISPGITQNSIHPKTMNRILEGLLEGKPALLLCPTFFKGVCKDFIRFPEDVRVGEDQIVFRDLYQKKLKFGSAEILTYSYNIHGENLHIKESSTSPFPTVVTKVKLDIGMILPFRDRNQMLSQFLDKVELPSYIKLYVVEHGPKETIDKELKGKLAGYLLLESEEGFNRSACFNSGVTQWNHSYYILQDCDLIPDIGFFKRLEQLIESRESIFMPWDRIEYLDEGNTQGLISGSKFSGTVTDKPIGGSIVFERSFFLRIGGMNADFKGWGFEDYELMERVKWFYDSPLKRCHSLLYHMWHGYDSLKPPRQLLESDEYKDNCSLFQWSKTLKNEERDFYVEKLKQRLKKSTPVGAAIILYTDDIDISSLENLGLPMIKVEKENQWVAPYVTDPSETILQQYADTFLSQRTVEVKTDLDFEDEWLLEVGDEDVEIVDLNKPIRPRVLIAADTPGWAFDRIANKMKKLLENDYEVEIVFSQSGYSIIGEMALTSCDVFIALGFCTLKGICKDRPGLLRKTIFCGYDHLHYEIPYRTPMELFVADDLEWLKDVGCITQSSKILQTITKRHLPNKEVLLVQDGVDSGLFRPKLNRKFSSDITVGWCGKTNGSSLKGVSIIEQACKRLGITFNCLDASKQRGKSTQDMSEFYDSIDVYACASLCEGTPNPILEASSCGIPWVSTNVGIVPEIWEQSLGGIIVNRSVDDFSKAFEWMRFNEKNRKKFGDQNRKAILNGWGWSNRLNPINEAIKVVLKSCGVLYES